MALDLNDKTSNGNNFTTNNNVTEYTTDFPFASCTEVAEFTLANSSYLSLNDTASLSLTSDFTFEVWARFKNTPSNGNAYTLISKFNDIGTPNYTYIWQLRNTGSLQTWMNYSADGSSTGPVGVNWTPTTLTWYHMALTFKASTKKLNFYINGSQQGTEQTGSFGSIFDNNKPFSLGAWDVDGTLSDKSDMQLTEVRIWNIVRTQTEISNNKDAHLTGSETGLVSYWPFQALSGGGATVIHPLYIKSLK